MKHDEKCTSVKCHENCEIAMEGEKRLPEMCRYVDLRIPTDYLADVIKIIRSGLKFESENSKENINPTQIEFDLNKWCLDQEEYLICLKTDKSHQKA